MSLHQNSPMSVRTESDPVTWNPDWSMTIRPPSRRRLKTIQLLVDIVGIALAYYIALSFRFHSVGIEQIFSMLVISFAAVNILCLYVMDLYHLEPQTALWKRPLQAIGAVILAGCIIVLYSYLWGNVEYSGVRGRGVLITAQLAFALWAATSRFMMLKWLRHVSVRSRWLVVGANGYLTAFVKDLSASRLAGHYGLITPEGVEFSDDFSTLGSKSKITFKREGTWAELQDLAKEPWSGIIVCAGNSLPESLVEILMSIRLKGIRVVDLADFYEQTWSKVPVFYLQRSWFAMAQGFQLLHNPIGLRIKRIFDILGASLLLALSAPILLLAIFAIKLESRGPVIFAQTRVGAGGRLFTVYKLRSMKVDAEKNGAQWASANDRRITRIGAFIRATRIDELPQLINVLKGDMSFIGPRPERPEFTGMLEREIPYYNLRHILQPGVTGWAQVQYPYGASVEDAKEKLQYDLYYIKNYSLILDVAIVLKTVRVVLFGKGR